MNVIFFSNLCSRTGSLDICMPRVVVLSGLLFAGVVGLAAWGGFELGERHGSEAAVDTEVEALRDLLADERRDLEAIEAEQRAHLDALALNVAELRARLIRLDALGDRLVEVGKLDKGEFDFTAEPPVGGVGQATAGEDASVSDLSDDMQRIRALLDDRETKLLTLEQMLMDRELMAEVTPSGRPVKKGWLSSGFGKRTDPFTGKRSYHRGIDFAGKPGTDIIAVASGVVTRSEYQSGYGNLVEIRHADGYSTVYAHNKENLVEVGDVVGKGETIALLGNTGRSSGPHVHLEVHRNGKIVNPRRFVR
jgi:murein DD-endopeptidase MepM/ murein hydrolase activator NlpD